MLYAGAVCMGWDWGRGGEGRGGEGEGLQMGEGGLKATTVSYRPLRQPLGSEGVSGAVSGGERREAL